MELATQSTLPVVRIGQLEARAQEQNWLIRSIWTNNSVGILGGAPKCCKSWLGLDMAVSVASKTPCLGRFEVQNSGVVLIYLAEDDLSDVRSRIEAMCAHRKIDLKRLDLFAITSSSLRLDINEDQNRLNATLEKLKPRLLLLDPLIRLHRLDENSSADISRILGFLRELQRRHQTSIVLVHHASKRHHAQPGQALRGSSDLHAFGDSNVYLARKQDSLVLTLEHRTTKPIDPLEIKLISERDNATTHLEVVSSILENTSSNLTQRVLSLLNTRNSPIRRTVIRSQLRINNQRLGDTLLELEKKGLILKQADGWTVGTETKVSSALSGAD